MMDREFGRFLEILDESNIDPTQIDLICKYIYFGLKQQFEIDPQLQNNQFQQFNQPMKMVQEEQQEFNQQNQFESFGGSEKNVPQNLGNQLNQGDDVSQGESDQEQEQEQGHDSESEQNSQEQSESETASEQESEIQQPQVAVNNNGQALHKKILSRISKIDKMINKQYRSLISTLLGFIFLTLITAIIKGYFTTQCPNDGNNEAQK